jgi:hypothetical protein
MMQSLRVLCFGLLFLLATLAQAQYPYFNQTHAVTGNAKVAGGTDGKHIYTASMTPDLLFYQIARFDSVGNFQTDYLYDKDTLGSYDGCARCMEIYNKRVYTATTHFQRSGVNPYILFLKLNSELDTLYSIDTLFAPMPYDKGLQIWGMKRDSDSTFLVTGEVVIETRPLPDLNWRWDPFVARLDTNFNLIWFTAIPDPVVHRFLGLVGQDLEVDSYGGIIVTGSPPFWSLQLNAWAARLRQKDGQLLWRKQYYNPPFGYSGLFVVDNGNGTYQYAMNKWVDNTGGVNLVEHGLMDTMGNRLSSHLMGNRSLPDGTPGQRANFIIDLVKTTDGNYYAAGLGYYGWYFGIGMKFTATGDSLWYRQYSSGTFDAQGAPTKVAFMENFIQKTDGSFVHVGFSRDIGSALPWYVWIFGTDANGNSIGITEQPSLVRWLVYPNPATDYLILQSEQVNAPNTQVRLLDLLGKEVWRAECTQAHYGCKLNLPPLAQGMYQLQLLQENRIVGQEKLILQP